LLRDDVDLSSEKPLLEVRGLKKYYPVLAGVLRRPVAQIQAVDGVDLTLQRGQALGLVGESGCGKSTTGRAILRLIEPTAGQILYRFQDAPEPLDVSRASPRLLKAVRRECQIIYQDPYSSLNGRMSVGDIVAEPLLVHGLAGSRERARLATEMIEAVGLNPAHLRRYPHEFSGGQRQRIAIARALVLRPRLVVADEPVSSLDVSVQAQVLQLLKDLQTRFDLTYLFISHDLAVVRYICDRVAVMYLGWIVESGPVEELFQQPRHPYTEALISAVPIPDPDRQEKRIILSGDVPSPVAPPSGCRFHPRCRYAREICAADIPEYRTLGPGRGGRCHLAEDLRLQGPSGRG
jgi:oligopeptide/dipeptide ABC transporter ATP-binding protein